MINALYFSWRAHLFKCYVKLWTLRPQLQLLLTCFFHLISAVDACMNVLCHQFLFIQLWWLKTQVMFNVVNSFVPLSCAFQCPTCSACLWWCVCCPLLSPSQQTHPRKLAIFPINQISQSAVFQAPRGPLVTREPPDSRGPWAPWGLQGWTVQMEKMERRVEREMQVFTLRLLCYSYIDLLGVVQGYLKNT